MNNDYQLRKHKAVDSFVKFYYLHKEDKQAVDIARTMMLMQVEALKQQERGVNTR